MCCCWSTVTTASHTWHTHDTQHTRIKWNSRCNKTSLNFRFQRRTAQHPWTSNEQASMQGQHISTIKTAWADESGFSALGSSSSQPKARAKRQQTPTSVTAMSLAEVKSSGQEYWDKHGSKFIIASIMNRLFFNYKRALREVKTLPDYISHPASSPMTWKLTIDMLTLTCKSLEYLRFPENPRAADQKWWSFRARNPGIKGNGYFCVHWSLWQVSGVTTVEELPLTLLLIKKSYSTWSFPGDQLYEHRNYNTVIVIPAVTNEDLLHIKNKQLRLNWRQQILLGASTIALQAMCLSSSFLI